MQKFEKIDITRLLVLKSYKRFLNSYLYENKSIYKIASIQKTLQVLIIKTTDCLGTPKIFNIKSDFFLKSGEKLFYKNSEILEFEVKRCEELKQVSAEKKLATPESDTLQSVKIELPEKEVETKPEEDSNRKDLAIKLKIGMLTQNLKLCFDYESGGYALINSHNQAKKRIKFLNVVTVKNLIAENLFTAPTDKMLYRLPKYNLTYNPKLEFGEIKNSKKANGFTLFNTHDEPYFKNLEPLFKDGYPVPDSIKKLFLNLFENNEGVTYSFRWLSFLVKRNKNETSLLLHGEEGSGKGLFVKLVQRMIGLGNIGTIENTTLESQFNEELLNKRVLFFNEMNTFGKNQGINNKLKTFITDSYLNIFVKNKAPFSVDNFSNIIIATNSDNAVKITMSDRRFNVFHQARALDKDVGRAIASLTDQEIYEFKNFLFNMDIDDFDFRTPFENESRTRMMMNTNTKKDILIYQIKNGQIDETISEILREEIGYNDKPTVYEVWLSNDEHFEGLIKRTAYESPEKMNITIAMIRDDVTLLKEKKILTSRLAVILYRESVDDLRISTTAIGRFYQRTFGKSKVFRTGERTIKGYKIEL